MTNDELNAALYEAGAAPEGAEVVADPRRSHPPTYWRMGHLLPGNSGPIVPISRWSPATDVAAAVEMAERKCQAYGIEWARDWERSKPDKRSHYAWASRYGVAYNPQYRAHAATAPRALSLAVRAALAAMKGASDGA